MRRPRSSDRGERAEEQEPPADAAAEAAETVADQNLAVAILDARGVPLASKIPASDSPTCCRRHQRHRLDRANSFGRMASSLASGTYRRNESRGSRRDATHRRETRAARSEAGDGDRHPDHAAARGCRRVVAGVDWPRTITRMAARAVRLPLTGSEIWVSRRGGTSSAN